jgi:hypothetical protein
MKFYYRNFSLILFALTVISTLAMHPAPKKSNTILRSCTVFILSPPGADPHDPDNWIPAPANFDPATDCPGAVIVCAICTNQIYPSTDPNYPNKPKVDALCGSGTICKRIDDVLSNHVLEGIADANDNIVWLRSNL